MTRHQQTQVPKPGSGARGTSPTMLEPRRSHPTHHTAKTNITNVLNIVQTSGCSVKSFNNISKPIIRKRHRKVPLTTKQEQIGDQGSKISTHRNPNHLPAQLQIQAKTLSNKQASAPNTFRQDKALHSLGYPEAKKCSHRHMQDKEMQGYKDVLLNVTECAIASYLS